MATRIEDPILGTLVKIEEASSLTGIPKPTLRLWRREQYRHLAKFDEYTHASSNAVWYRLADIEGWLIANGKDPKGNRTMFTKSEAPNAYRAPLGEAVDARKHEAITQARRLNRNNHRELRLKWLKDYDNPTMAYFSYVKKFLPELTELWFKGETPTPFIKAYPGYDGLHPAVNTEPDPADRERYDFIMTNITRLIDADLNNRELSAADAASIPVI